MDPAALGTTIIGLDTIRHDEQRYERAVVHHDRRRRRPGSLRLRLAHVLRRTAERIAPVPTPA